MTTLSKVSFIWAAMPTLLALSVGIMIVGCGESAPGPDPKVEAARLDNAQKMRSIFDGAHGAAYESLSAADRAAYSKAAGGDSQARKAWDDMTSASKPVGAGAPVGSSAVSHDGPQAAGK